MKRKNLELSKKLILNKENIALLNAGEVVGGSRPTFSTATCDIHLCLDTYQASCQNTCNQNTCYISCVGGTCMFTGGPCGC